MANAWCLPKSESRKLLEAIQSGKVNTLTLNSLDSAGRRKEFAKIVGDDLAQELNANYEKQIIVNGYQKGLATWISNSLKSLDEKALKNIETKINSLDEKILNPDTEKAFLSDLAADSLGFKLNPEQAKLIFEKAQEAKQLREEWVKTLDQDIPRRAINDPVNITRQAYGHSLLDLSDLVESMKPSGQTWIQHALDVWNAPKTLVTGILHFSAIGVQGWGMISKKVTWEAVLEQFKYFYDEKNYRDLQAYVISHPDYEFARSAKLGLTDVTDQLSLREEAIQSSILQRMNTYVADKSGLPINVLGASSRAFTGFLTYTRFNRFVNLLAQARKINDTVIKPGDQIVKDLGSVVNNFTGRSNLGEGDTASNIQSALNGIFFAPRKMAATMQMFNPVEYMWMYKNARESGNYTAINAAFDQLTGSILATASILYLANMTGYGVEVNPIEQDFLKVKMPNGEKLDVTGGNAIYIRLWARILTNKEITAHGKEIDLGEGYKATTSYDLLQQYVRGKLGVVPGMLIDSTVGADAVGRPYDIPQELRGHFEPILMSSMMNYYYDQPEKAISDMPILAGLFGVAVESPTSRGIRFGRDVWGQDTSILHDPERTELDAALDHIGYVQDFPSKTINGIKLTDEQQQQYNQIYGTVSKARLSNLVASPWYNTLSDSQKLAKVKQMVQVNKFVAQNKIIGKHPQIFIDSMKQQKEKLMELQGNAE